MATGTYKVDLSKIWLFSSCSNKELNTIRKNLEAEITKPGKDLVKQGDIGQEFYLIVNGKASVKRNNRKAATLGPGDYFGELVAARPPPSLGHRHVGDRHGTPHPGPASVQRRA